MCSSDLVEIATSTFERASFDLIYARPGQTPATWRDELGEALRRAPEHLSLYQLTIEPDTMFERLRDAGRLPLDHLSSTTLFEHFGILVPDSRRHTALGDALATFELYWKLVGLMR